MIKIELTDDDALDYLRMVNKDVNNIAQKTVEAYQKKVAELEKELANVNDTPVPEPRESE